MVLKLPAFYDCPILLLQTQEDLEGILDVCAKHGVQFMDGTMWSHNPRVRMMESALKEIGPVRAVHSIFTFLGKLQGPDSCIFQIHASISKCP